MQGGNFAVKVGSVNWKLGGDIDQLVGDLHRYAGRCRHRKNNCQKHGGNSGQTKLFQQPHRRSKEEAEEHGQRERYQDDPREIQRRNRNDSRDEREESRTVCVGTTPNQFITKGTSVFLLLLLVQAVNFSPTGCYERIRHCL